MKIPIYVKIHNEIKSEIEAGKWAKGTKIPAERILSEKYGVSRMTLRQSIQSLVDEGILEKRIGSGTFVANEKVQEKMKGITSFSELMIQQHKIPTTKLVAYHVNAPSKNQQSQLALKNGENVLVMERIRFGDGIPICFEIATIPVKFVANINKNQLINSLYKTIREQYDMGGAIQRVSALNSSERIAKLLNINKGDALLNLTQTTFLKNNEPFEYVKSYYVGQRFEFYLER